MLRRARWIYPALMCVLIALFYLVPAAGGALAGLIGLVSAGTVTWVALTGHPARRSAWLLIAAAIVVLTVGEVAYSTLATGGPPDDFPSVPDVFTAVAYPLLAAGLLCLSLSRAPSRDVNLLIDIAVASLAGILVVWITLIRPAVDTMDLTGFGKVIAVATGVGDVVVLAAAIRMVVAWRSCTAAWLLGAAVAGLLTADALYAIDLVHGTWHSGGPVDLGILGFFALSGAAALAPSMRRLGSVSAVDRQMGVWGLVLLSVALMVAPSALLAEAAPGPVRTPVAIAVVSAAIGALTIARMMVSARGYRRALDRERIVRLTTRRLGLAMTTSDVTTSLSGALAAMTPDGRGEAEIVDAPVWTAAPNDRGRTGPGTDLLVPIEDDTARTGQAIRFAAAPGHLTELDDVLIGLGEQAGIALHRIDLAHRVRESEIEQDVLLYRASHDGLTGLANAELFRDELRSAGRAADGTRLTAVIFIDLDDFKAINDSLGHEVGDAVLRVCAQRIRSSLRRGDIGARLGGDEFAILLRGLTDPHAATAVAARLADTLAQPAQVNGVPVDCAASVGLAGARTAGEHDALMRRADAALYAAKAAGKGRWMPYDDSMQSPMRRTADLRTELDKALRSRPAATAQAGLSLHYQPIVVLQTGVVRGFEALIRWEHPRYGAIPVTDLIAVAEQTGLIVPLGDWVLTRALADAVRLNGAADGPRYISVNVSAPQLRDPGFTQRIRDQLTSSGLDPRLLVLEITESQLVREDEPMWSELKVLRDQGVRLAIDDYGTGYASMSYLRRPIIDIVKLDQSFIGNVDEDRPRTLLRAVLSLTQELGIDLVAEGIERPEIRRVLIESGCRYGQGHLFAAAMPLDEALRRPDRVMPA